MNRYTQQEAENLDYSIDLTAWLATGDSIISTTASAAPSGLTVGVTGSTTSVPKVWLSGGTDGTEYQITALMTTNAGRIKEVDFKLKVANR
jgi:hypothetical protein